MADETEHLAFGGIAGMAVGAGLGAIIANSVHGLVVPVGIVAGAWVGGATGAITGLVMGEYADDLIDWWGGKLERRRVKKEITKVNAWLDKVREGAD